MQRSTIYKEAFLPFARYFSTYKFEVFSVLQTQ